MDIGLTIGIRRYPNDQRSFAELHRDCIETAVLAEELGWDHVWMPEHHLSDLWTPSPFAVLAAVAARTSRIRMGTYVVLLALHDPIRMAEDIATVDSIADGRLDFGVGAAPMQVECDLFQIPEPETYARTYESLSIIERCFTEAEFTHHGKHYHYNNVTFSPKSVQQPFPPIWLAAMGPQSAARAARRGYFLAAGMGRAHDIYVQAWIQSGRDPQDMQISSVPLYGHIAESRQQAWDDYEAAQYYRDRS